MLNRFKTEDEGFTLIELLVVILIIGILAAIALPSFLGQQQKGQDASAKSNARNAVSQLEACFADEQDYTKCSPTLLGDAGIQNTTFTATATGFVATANSEAKEGAVPHKFMIEKKADGTVERTCTPEKKGGCKTGGTW